MIVHPARSQLFPFLELIFEVFSNESRKFLRGEKRNNFLERLSLWPLKVIAPKNVCSMLVLHAMDLKARKHLVLSAEKFSQKCIYQPEDLHKGSAFEPVAR